MELSTIVSPDSVVTGLKSNSKKQLLQEMAQMAAQKCAFDERAIFEGLLDRERLGSTGVGNGVAIPHTKLPGLDRIYGFMARLAKPLEFESIDDQPVDIVFMLLAPEGSGAEHLKALSRIARVLREPNTLAQIRSTDDADTIYSLVVSLEKATAA